LHIEVEDRGRVLAIREIQGNCVGLGHGSIEFGFYSRPTLVFCIYASCFDENELEDRCVVHGDVSFERRIRASEIGANQKILLYIRQHAQLQATPLAGIVVRFHVIRLERSCRTKHFSRRFITAQMTDHVQRFVGGVQIGKTRMLLPTG
jgi:hypothetical protein